MPESLTLTWKDGLWTHVLTPEGDGRFWRWRAVYDDGLIEPIESDFGLVPGGIYVAVERLVRRQVPDGIAALSQKTVLELESSSSCVAFDWQPG